MSEITVLLDAIHEGDAEASAQLWPLVYEELRRLAARKLASERPGQTLQPTALVHEAYLRLIGGKNPEHWRGRNHFFIAAAKAMRRILVENARRKQRIKHGGGLKRCLVDEAFLLAPEPSEDLLALDEALTRLAVSDPAAAELVQLRYFGGLSVAEAAQVLGMSLRSAERLWAYTRVLLFELIDHPTDEPS